MTQEVMELAGNMNLAAAETQIALHCAPLLVGLKVSSLLMMTNEQAGRIFKLSADTELACFWVFCGEKKTVLLLYRMQSLDDYLKTPDVLCMLRGLGYQGSTLAGLLADFAARYAAYAAGGGMFPHEMGLFLGYPPEDVQGFMADKGKNSLCTGYWKVYQNVQEKIGLFQKYDLAREKLLRLMAHGVSIKEVMALRPV